MNEKYLAILELAKKKEGWKERCEELKFGTFYHRKYYNKSFIERINFIRSIDFYEEKIKTGRFKILGQFSKSDLVEWLGDEYCLYSNCICKIGNFDIDINPIHNFTIELNDGELFEQSDEVLDQVIELMEKELT